MKKDCFHKLREMTAIAQSACLSLSGKIQYDYSEGKRLSEKALKECLDIAVKQFVTPIDREDIAYMALKLNRLNGEIYRLARFKNSFFPNKDIAKLLEPLINICKSIVSAFADCSTRVDHPGLYGAPFAEDAFAENRYSPFCMILEYRLQTIIERCYDTAADITDYMIRTAIKNS